MALTAQTREADDLARPDVERDRSEAVDAEVFHGERRSAFHDARGPAALNRRAADDLLDQLLRRDFQRAMNGDDMAVAQNRDRVCDTEDLVETMADVDDADAIVAQPPQDLEEAIDVRLRQAGSRLVEHEQLSVP